MNEPVSGAGVTKAVVSGATLGSLLATDTGVFIGAFAGAVVYVLSAKELSRLAQVGYFCASFIIGVLGADLAAAVIMATVGSHLPNGVVVSKYLGAAVSASLGVGILLWLKQLNITVILRRLLPGGTNDDK